MRQARLNVEAKSFEMSPGYAEVASKLSDYNPEAKDDGISTKDEYPPITATVNELRSKLQEAYREIELKNEALDKKDHDLIMAAELGACLIDDNENLKKLCLKYTTSDAIEEILVVSSKTSQSSKKLQDHTGNPDSNLSTVQKCNEELKIQARHLEAKIETLQESLSARDAEIKKLNEFRRASGRQLSSISEEKDAANSKLAEANENMKILEEANKKLNLDNAKFHETILTLQKKLEASRNAPEIAMQYNSLKEQNLSLIKQRSALGKEKAELSRQLEESKQILHARSCEADEAKNEIVRMEDRQRSLEWELASERELVSKLQLQLTPVDVGQNDLIVPSAEATGGPLQKSLFSEVDDRRKELENKNNEIMKAHMAYVHRQEMMKEYIKRALSITNLKNSDSRIKRLEEALSQAESEKKELSTRLNILEKRLATMNRKSEAEFKNYINADSNARTPNEYSNKSGDDVVKSDTHAAENGGNFSSLDSIERECLISTASSLREECMDLAKEVKTLRLLNANELGKLRAAESLLRDREDELVRVKAYALQIKLEFDTLKGAMCDGPQHGAGLLQNLRPSQYSTSLSPLPPKNTSNSIADLPAGSPDVGDTIRGLFQQDDSFHEKSENSTSTIPPLDDSKSHNEILGITLESNTVTTKKFKIYPDTSPHRDATPEVKRLRVNSISHTRRSDGVEYN